MVFLAHNSLMVFQQHLSKSIENVKDKYFSNISEESNNPTTSMKCYWFLPNILLNGKKVSCVLPIYDNNSFFADFKKKCQLFNSYISVHCTSLKNSILLNTCSKYTSNTLDTISFLSYESHFYM